MSVERATVIRGGRVICPVSGIDERRDITLRGNRIASVGAGGPPPDVVIDASGMVVCPALIDLHAHLREPGGEHKETIDTGTRAAVRGGFATVCAMPNTQPPPDRAARVAEVHRRIRRSAWCRVGIIGAATRENDRERLTDFAELRDAGCVAVSDDAFMLTALAQRREALLRCAEAGLIFIAHAEAEELSAGGVMHESALSRELAVPGQDAEAEVRALEAWREAWDEPGAPPLHIAHLSTAAGARLLRDWKDGPTAETAPHYLALTHQAIAEQGANAKMNPPLRTEEDRLALIEAVRGGVVEVVATDHAPHTPKEKSAGLVEAPFGIVGLETGLSVVVDVLVGEAGMSLAEALATLTCSPARVLDLPGGRIEVGAPADLLIFAPDERWTVAPERFETKGRNTPFAGRELPGRVETLIIDGRVIYAEGRFAGTRRPRGLN